MMIMVDISSVEDLRRNWHTVTVANLEGVDLSDELELHCLT